jgi:hypothetical protein
LGFGLKCTAAVGECLGLSVVCAAVVGDIEADGGLTVAGAGPASVVEGWDSSRRPLSLSSTADGEVLGDALAGTLGSDAFIAAPP